MQTLFWLILFFLFFVGCNTFQSAPSAIPAAMTPTPTPVQASLESGWASYTDDKYAYKVDYRATLKIDHGSPNSSLFSQNNGIGGPAFPVFYISVIPKGFTNPDASVYNFIADSYIPTIAATKIGDSFTVATLPEGFNSFQRLADVMVAGKQGIVVESEKVWEGTPDTKDRRIFVTLENEVYEFGTYYKTSQELDQFNKVVESVQFP